jgi:hypothetical protein
VSKRSVICTNNSPEILSDLAERKRVFVISHICDGTTVCLQVILEVWQSMDVASIIILTTHCNCKARMYA